MEKRAKYQLDRLLPLTIYFISVGIRKCTYVFCFFIKLSIKIDFVIVCVIYNYYNIVNDFDNIL